MVVAVPKVNSQVVDTQGRTGVAQFDPNTGKPLAGAGAFNANTGQPIPAATGAVADSSTPGQVAQTTPSTVTPPGSAAAPADTTTTPAPGSPATTTPPIQTTTTQTNTTPAPGSSTAAKYQATFAAGAPSGTNLDSSGSARSAVGAVSSQVAPASSTDEPYQPSSAFLATGDPIMNQYISSALDSMNEITNKGATVNSIKENFTDQLNNLDVQEMNLNNIMNGTDDDIRSEISKAGGFATESQVQAIASGRNKDLLKQYNSLEMTKTSLTNEMNAQVGLAQDDLQFAEDKYNNATKAETTYASIKQNNQTQVWDQVTKFGFAQFADNLSPYEKRTVAASMGWPADIWDNPPVTAADISRARAVKTNLPISSGGSSGTTSSGSLDASTYAAPISIGTSAKPTNPPPNTDPAGGVGSVSSDGQYIYAKTGNSYGWQAVAAPSTGAKGTKNMSVLEAATQSVLKGLSVPSQYPGQGKNSLRAQVQSAVLATNPNFDFEKAEQGYAFGKAQKTQQTLSTLSYTIDTLDALKPLSENVDRGSITFGNKAGQWLKYSGSDKNTVAFITKVNGGIDDVAAALGGGVSTDAKIEIAKSILDPTLSKDAFDTQINTNLSTINSRMGAIKAQTGRAVEINGNYYDVGSTITNGNGEQATVNSDGTLTPLQ